VICPFCRHPSFLLGDLQHGEFDSIQSQQRAVAGEFMSYCTRVEDCRDCLFVRYCGCGCRGNALSTSGSLFGLDPYCEFYKSYFWFLIASLIRFPNSPRNLCAQKPPAGFRWNKT
jgi:radical SAM protein with 4Fe4S-binding SPASM domain